jgi:hypothetical protein
MYKEAKISLITNSGKVLTSEINLEVRHGCGTTPTLLNVCLDVVRQ